MLFNALKIQSHDYFDFIERQIALGLDAYVQIPIRPPIVVNDHYNLHGLPVSHDPRITIQEWVSHPIGEEFPILVKEYHTPAGSLVAEVRQTADWRWGNHVPFLDDYITPRSKKFLIAGQSDLEALRYLLHSPLPQEIAAFQEEAKQTLAFAQKQRLLVAGGWGVGADVIGWIYGLENMMYATYDQPEFLAALLDLISVWNRRRMEVILEVGIDLYIKRAWYENCDFWTPETWRQYIFPILKAETNLAHERGAKFGYLITSNCMPLLELFVEAGVDVLVGVDPREWDLAGTKQELGGKVCLWGGVNGHITIETGMPQDVIDETKQAIEILSPNGGFILSPVDNVREATPRSMKNVEIMIREWQRSISG